MLIWCPDTRVRYTYMQCRESMVTFLKTEKRIKFSNENGNAGTNKRNESIMLKRAGSELWPNWSGKMQKQNNAENRRKVRA